MLATHVEDSPVSDKLRSEQNQMVHQRDEIANGAKQSNVLNAKRVATKGTLLSPASVGESINVDCMLGMI